MKYAIIADMSQGMDIPVDGRTQRSERSREAIVQAMLELIREGTLVPTAQQVAERATVGVRTVFRHFSDMETLFATMNDRLTEQASPLFIETVQAGPFPERVERFVERRIEIYELLGPYTQASAVQCWRSPFLQGQHEHMVRVFRRDLGRWLPELDSATTEAAAAAELATSLEAWHRLRFDQALSQRRATSVVRLAIRELLAP